MFYNLQQRQCQGVGEGHGGNTRRLLIMMVAHIPRTLYRASMMVTYGDFLLSW